MPKVLGKRLYARKKPDSKQTWIQAVRWQTGINQKMAAAHISKVLNKSISHSLYQKIEQGSASVLQADAVKITMFWGEMVDQTLDFDNFWKEDLIITKNGKEI